MNKKYALPVIIAVLFIAFAVFKTYATPVTGSVGVECNAESLTIHLPSPQAWVSLKWSDIARACKESK